MSELRDKLPLRQEVTVDDTYQYDFLNGTDKQVRPRPYADRVSEYPAMVDWINDQKEEFTSREGVLSKELQACFVEAKLFVEQLTGHDLSSVGLIGQAQEKGNDQTMYYTPIDRNVHSFIDIGAGMHTSNAARLTLQMFTTYLVHELMHATRNNNKFIGIQHANNKTQVIALGGLHTADMRTPKVRTYNERGGVKDLRAGHFFEEAAAEEAACRWREASVEGVAENGNRMCQLNKRGYLPGLPLISRLSKCGHQAGLPFRFIDSAAEYQEIVTDYIIASSAYPAAGLYAISNYTGVDIFQLILDAKKPENEAAARRKIIQTVESVQKGLYPKLRDTIYTEKTFVQSYEMIMRTIDKKKRQCAKIGSTVVTCAQPNL